MAKQSFTSVNKMETGYDVGAVMSKNVLTIEPEASIIKAAKLMAEKKLGSIIAVRRGKVVGILTEQDLARRVLAKGINPERTSVSKAMSKKVITISADKDLYEAMLLMSLRRIKHLPVVKAGRLIGLISFKDIIRLEPDLIDMVSFKSSLTKGENKSIFTARA
jgi:signal-transduction protein with cAMP-binding, CBS, and nucleotidyltransferase domain